MYVELVSGQRVPASTMVYVWDEVAAGPLPVKVVIPIPNIQLRQTARQLFQKVPKC